MKQSKHLSRKLTALVLGGLFSLSLASAATAEARSLALSESVELALENNRSIKSSVTDVDAADWAYHEARRTAGPKLTLSTQGNRVGGKAYKLYDHDYAYRSAAELSFPLYTGGRIEHGIEAARYGVNTADLALESTKQAVRYQTTGQYFKALEYRNLIKVGEISVANLKSHLDNVNAQYRVGTVARSDVLASQVSLANAEQSLVNVTNNYDVAIAELNKLIGLPTGTALSLADELALRRISPCARRTPRWKRRAALPCRRSAPLRRARSAATASSPTIRIRRTRGRSVCRRAGRRSTTTSRRRR